MTNAVYLHIGTMKAGTTFLQHGLKQYASTLEQDGVLFPAQPSYRHQVAAVRDLLRLPGPMPPAELVGAWARLCTQVSRWDGPRVVISVEQLCLARPIQIDEALASLAPADVHVVITCRDIARVMPSTWQENLQNGLTWTWAEFCASVTDQPGAPAAAGDRFWKQHDLPSIVERWSAAVGTDHVHLVTVPPTGTASEVLWHRFGEAIGVDLSRYPVQVDRVDRNAGLDRAAAEMLLRLNTALGERLDRAAYAQHVKRVISKQVLGSRVPRLPIRLEPGDFDWATERSLQVVATLERSGVDVIGDLAELIPAAQPAVDPASADPAAGAIALDDEIGAAALAASAAAVRELGERIDRRTRGQGPGPGRDRAS